jgi:hypothetical protein
MVEPLKNHPWKRGCTAEKAQGKCRAIIFHYKANRP